MAEAGEWVVLGLAGAVVGSFLGVVVRRLPRGEAVMWGRSRCERCGHGLAARDLVPLLSFAALRGRCRHCGARIDAMHPAIEFAGVLVALSAGWADGNDPARLAAGCVLGWGLLALAWIDAETMTLPDALTLPLVLLGLGATAALDRGALAGHAAAALVGYGLLAGLAAGFRRLRGYDGLGMGDAKLLAAAGAWQGLAGLAPVMLGGAVLGLGLAACMAVGGRAVAGRVRLPFGPCLALATWAAWLWGVGWAPMG